MVMQKLLLARHQEGPVLTPSIWLPFWKRLKMLYSHWNEYNNDLWGASEVLAIATPLPSEDLRYLKSSALNVWLVGYEFLDTIMVFMKKQIHFLCSQKKASLLEVVKKTAKEVVDAEVVMHVKAKNDDGTALMDSIFRAVRAQSKLDDHDTPVVGYIAREIPEGNLLETWAEKLKNANFQLSDITNGFSDLFAVKDSAEITNVKKAAYLTSSVMKHFVIPMLEKVIDEEKKVSHSSLIDDKEKVILEPAKVKAKLKAGRFQSALVARSASTPFTRVCAAAQLPRRNFSSHDVDIPVVEVQVSSNSNGQLVGKLEGEEVVFPQLEPTLEWLLGAPCDVHLFNETPVVKECPEHQD